MSRPACLLPLRLAPSLSLCLPLCLPLCLLACGDAAKVEDACAELPAAPGIAATVDGGGWSSSGAWSEAGTAIQITTEAADGWRMTLVASLDDEGREALTALDALPARFTLGGDGGNATLYPDGGGSLSTGQEGGSGAITFASREGDAILGCFDFVAVSSDGDEAGADGGQFWADPSTL